MENHKTPKRLKDRQSRATKEKVLDPKTLAVLKKLIDRKKLINLCGCISTGKEAHIYTGEVTLDLNSKFVRTDEKYKIRKRMCGYNKAKKDGLCCDDVDEIENVIGTEQIDNQIKVKKSSDDKNKKLRKELKKQKNEKKKEKKDLKKSKKLETKNDSEIKKDKENKNSEENILDENNKEEKIISETKNDLERRKDKENKESLESKNDKQIILEIISETKNDLENDKDEEINLEEKENILENTNDLKFFTEKLTNEKSVDFEDEKNILETQTNSEENSLKTIKCAIKIYGTSILEFKNRDKYIENDARFNSYSRKNPRKLIKVWAEKEVRNLLRINSAKIPSPFPIYLKNNILIMSLIVDENGEVVPKLKDAVVENYSLVYEEVLNLMQQLFFEAKLVHGDLSEYNLLFYKHIYVIDVGQSVDTSHPNWKSLLIIDILNVNRFFKKKGVSVFDTSVVFERVSGLKVPISLEGVDLNVNCFIPEFVSEAGNEEDAKIFLKMENCRIDDH